MNKVQMYFTDKDLVLVQSRYGSTVKVVNIKLSDTKKLSRFVSMLNEKIAKESSRYLNMSNDVDDLWDGEDY